MPTTDNLVLAVLAMLDLDDFSKNYCDMKNAEKNPTLGTYIKELDLKPWDYFLMAIVFTFNQCRY